MFSVPDACPVVNSVALSFTVITVEILFTVGGVELKLSVGYDA